MSDGLKRTVKGAFYRATASDWMIHDVVCPLTGRKKKDYTSSKTWKKGEMYFFLSWLQCFAAEKGCVLESIGDFKKNQESENA